MSLIGNYKVIGEIGSTPSSKVKLGENIHTNEKVAIKIINIDSLHQKPHLYSKFQRQVAIMHLMKHPHLVRLYDVFESQHHVHIVQEYAPKGELFYQIKQHGHFSEIQGLNFFRQIIEAIEFMHEHNICHRDIKPENILLDQFDEIKIAGFAFTSWMKADSVKTQCGTPQYAAPEITKGKPYDGRAADVWSAGVCLFGMLAGRLPFDDPSIRNLIQKIRKCEYEMPPFSSPIKDLLSKIFVSEPSQRLTVSQIKRHPAYFIGLPEGYILPEPLPIPLLIDPCDMNSISPQILETLLKIGYNEDELKTDLTSNEHSMAKVFLFMLTNRQTPEQLPWDQSNDNKVIVSFQISDENDQIDPNDQINSNALFGSGPKSFKLRKDFKPLGTPVSYSLMEKSQWQITSEPVLDFEQIQPIEGIKMKIEEVMKRIQEFLQNENPPAQWFYPDNLTILSKIQETFISFHAQYSTNQLINITVCMNHGTNE